VGGKAGPLWDGEWDGECAARSGAQEPRAMVGGPRPHLIRPSVALLAHPVQPIDHCRRPVDGESSIGRP
jgi:hypothetical protein